MQSLALDANEVAAIRKRNPDAFQRPLWKRFTVPLGIAISILYIVYCSWFFSFSKVFGDVNWQIAGNYLYDWFSYEVRPDIDYRNGEIKIEFPRYSPLGENPNPDWIKTREGTVTIVGKKKRQTSTKKIAQDSFMSPSATQKDGANSDESILDKVGEEGFSFMAPQAQQGSASSNKNNNEKQEITKETKQGIAEATALIGNTAVFEITPNRVIVTHKKQALEIAVDAQTETVTPLGALPSWATQKRGGGKVRLDFGFSGRAEVRATETKISRRYFGWENFFFDTRSPYWGMSWSTIASHLTGGPRLVEKRSNWSLLWDNIINNAKWQHGDVWIKLLQTIVMAFVGTLFAVIVAFPLSFFAARNITPNLFVNQVLKRAFDFFRSVDMLIWALFFTRAFGPGPLAGISAIFFTDTGTFGKLYSEALENIDEKQREGVRSVGASNMQIQRYGVVPQVLPVLISQALYFWESNTRSATIIGAVGAGGIGLKLWEAMRTNQNWENVAYMVVLILIVVFIFDNVSNAIRSRLIGKQA